MPVPAAPSAAPALPAAPVLRGTVAEAFDRAATRYGGHDFLCVLPHTARRYGIEPRAWSFGQASAQIEDCRRRYRAAGLGPGQRVGLLLENQPAMFFHWLALNALGVSVVPIPSEWRSAELAYLVAHSGICVAVVPPEREREIQQAAHASGGRLPTTPPDLSGLQAMTLAGPPAQPAPDEQSECALLYTSGTTGQPKGCVLTNEYYLWAGTWYQQAGGLCQLRPGEERLLTPLPMSHMNAMAFSTLAMILSGGCVVPLDRFHPSAWWPCVRESRATIVHYLGVMPAMLLGAPAEPGDRDHAVRFGFGAGVSPRLHAEFERRFGFPLLEAWAMTETGAGAVAIANRAPRKIGSACFGKPGTHVDYRVVDERGGDAGVGEPGELWVRSATDRRRFGFFREYWKDDEATAAAWEGGYFHTGDLVCADADGDLHFLDRRKNVIRRSGENVSAAEVESVILQHPQVASVAVAAVPDELRGDEVMACVVLRGEVPAVARAALARELQEFCLQRLAYFKAPGYVAFCDRLPLTPTEKIQRAQLKELARGLLGGRDTADLRALKKRPGGT